VKLKHFQKLKKHFTADFIEKKNSTDDFIQTNLKKMSSADFIEKMKNIL
jgi:hypothetical protein